MSGAHLDHPGEVHWFHGYGPLPVVGPCPHTNCPHNGTSVIAWGPDYEHYELVTCDVDAEDGGCAEQCRGWWTEYPIGEANQRGIPRYQPPREWLNVPMEATL